MKIIPYGDSALLINFKQVIDPAVNTEAVNLNKAIEKAGISGIAFQIPAYCSITIGFNPDQITFQELKMEIEALGTENTTVDSVQRVITIPVCYDNEFAMDKKEIMDYTGLAWDEVKHHHTSNVYQVYMLGFLPGFVYLGKTSPAIEVPRKKNPRLKVPALSVGLAGVQTGIYPSDAPGGWQIIGKTPVKTFDNRRDNPFLFEPGMKVAFREINRSDFEEIESAMIGNTFNPDSLYESNK